MFICTKVRCIITSYNEHIMYVPRSCGEKCIEINMILKKVMVKVTFVIFVSLLFLILGMFFSMNVLL